MRFDIHLHFDPDEERKLDWIIAALKDLKQQGTVMSKELDDLTAEVTATKGVVASAVTAIAGLRQQIIDAGTDPAALQALTDDLKASETALAAAIATPGGP